MVMESEDFLVHPGDTTQEGFTTMARFVCSALTLTMVIESLNFIVEQWKGISRTSRLETIMRFQFKMIQWERRRIMKLNNKIQKRHMDKGISIVFDALFEIQLSLDRLRPSISVDRDSEVEEDERARNGR